jgi:hypothetical protein
VINWLRRLLHRIKGDRSHCKSWSSGYWYSCDGITVTARASDRAFPAMAARGDRPRCGDLVDHAIWTSDP